MMCTRSFQTLSRCWWHGAHTHCQACIPHTLSDAADSTCWCMPFLSWHVVPTLRTPADSVKLDVRQHWRLRKVPYSLPCNPQGSTPCSTRAPVSTAVHEEQP